MKIIQKSLATLLVICMTFSLLPSTMLPTVSAEVLGKDNTGNLSGSATNSTVGGAMSTDEIVFRTSLSRDPNNYLDGTAAQRQKVINYYSLRYPDIKNIKSSSLYFWPYDIYNQFRNEVGISYYTNQSLSWDSSATSKALNIRLNRSGSNTNTFKTKVLTEYNAKRISGPADLTQFKWKNYLPTKAEALNVLSYIYEKYGGVYHTADRTKEVIGAAYDGLDPSKVTKAQKDDMTFGYTGLLTCFYTLVKDNPNTKALAGEYETAIEEYLGNKNSVEKPVTLVTEACMSVVIDADPFNKSANFAIPLLDYIRYTLLPINSADMVGETGAAFLGADGSKKLTTTAMLEKLAAASAKNLSYSKTYATTGRGTVRIADMGSTYMTNVHTSTALGRIACIAQLKKQIIGIKSNSTGWMGWKTSNDYPGLLKTLELSEGTGIYGFTITGQYLSNPEPQVSYYVDDTTKTTFSRCEQEVSVKEPPEITMYIKGDSSLISSLSPRKDDTGFEGLKIVSTVTRTKLEGTTVLESNKKMPELEAELNNLYTKDELVDILKGRPIKLLDVSVLNEKFLRDTSGDKIITYVYNIDIDITIDKETYKYKKADIVTKMKSGALNDFSSCTIPFYTTEILLPEDIVITKPNSTLTTDIINPSENENLSEMTQMISRYEYTTGGEEFAEIKNNKPLNETYEVMAGVPSTEELYFSVGGSEFKVATVVQYWMNEHSRDRTYTVHFNGNKCEFNNSTESKGDTWKGDKIISKPPESSGSTISSNLDLTHTGGTITVTWTGTTKWTGKSEANGCHGWTLINTWDDSNYNSAVAAANAFSATLKSVTQAKWKSASDLELREFNFSSSNASVSISSSNTHIPGTGSGGSHEVPPSKDSPGSPERPGSGSPGSDNTYTVTLTAVMPAHAICGPCCGHMLPDIYDTWRQGLVFDFAKISQIRLFKLDQGSVTNMTELTGSDRIFASVMSGNPTYFMNIAQLTEKKAPISVLPEGTGTGGLTSSYMEEVGNTYSSYLHRKVSQSSRDGRLRYILDPTFKKSDVITYSEQGDGSTSASFTIDYNKIAAPEQHDDVVYEAGARSKNCDGMATTGNFGKSSANNVKAMDKQGHVNKWADGILYTNIQNQTIPSDYFSAGSRYTPVTQRVNDANVSKYREDYNHHVQRNGLKDKTGYSDKADQRDILTPEWKFFDNARRTKIIVNVISDFLILQTSGGDQSIIYYEKASPATEAQEHFQKVKITEDELFTNNALSVFNKVSTCNAPMLKNDNLTNMVVVGGYNGQYNKPADKYKPYSLVTGEFLPFAGAGTTYNATTKLGTYKPYGGSQIQTIFDKDPSLTISRPERLAKDQNSSFKIYQDGIRIIPTTLNKLYTPEDARVFYPQIVAYYSSDNDAISAETGTRGVGPLSNVNIGWKQWSDPDRVTSYRENWGTKLGVDANTVYFGVEGDKNTTTVNSVVVYTPVSTEDALVLNQEDLDINGMQISRDQRANAFDYPDMNDMVNALKVCPLDPELCEYRTLDCKYLHDTVLADFDFSETYKTIEQNVVDGKVVKQEVTKKNTYLDGGNWITTNKTTGLEYALPSGFTIESGSQVGDGRYLHATGTRWSIPFGDLGLSNVKTNRVGVELDLTVNSGANNLMLVSFYNYGFLITPSGLPGSFITRSPSNAGRIGARADMSRNTSLNHVKLSLVFGFNSVIDCTATVNGVPATVTISELRNVWRTVGGTQQLQLTQEILTDFAKDPPNTLQRTDIGTNLNIGSWGSDAAYRADYYIDNLKVVLKGGTQTHNSTCYKTMTIHATNKIHTHTADCYLKNDIYTCDGKLNSNYQHNANYANNYYGSPTCGQGAGYYVTEYYWYCAGHCPCGTSGWVQNHSSTGYDANVHYHSCAGDNYAYFTGQSRQTLVGHVHSGSAGWGANGCYSAPTQHVHTGTAGLDYANGCYTKPTVHKHNMSVKTLTCDMPEGGDGQIRNYSYTGGMQSVTLPSGRYRLETWGAQGGDGEFLGGLGGYSIGEITLNVTTNLYIGVGGKGGNSISRDVLIQGGYNGGGQSWGSTGSGYATMAAGGGATHIATINGELGNLVSNKNSVLIVAGGGGGAGSHSNTGGGAGGAGGGLVGGNGVAYGSYGYGSGGTQTLGGTNILGSNNSGMTFYMGTFGLGGYMTTTSQSGGWIGGGGGGGYYGGGAGGAISSGGGGSGYIGGVTSGSTQAGVNSGNGKAKITNLDHKHTDACYTTTGSTCPKESAGTLVCTGELNTETNFNVHVHNASCLTTETKIGSQAFQANRKMETYVVPYTDYYTIEAYGSSVNNVTGYVKGTVKLSKGTILYISVGTKDGYNDGITDIRLKPPIKSDGSLESEEIKADSLKSRMFIAGKTAGTSSIVGTPVKPITSQIISAKNSDGEGRVYITPQNSALGNILNDIVSGAIRPDKAKDYLGEDLYNQIMVGSEKVLHTWSGWSTSNDKGFKVLSGYNPLQIVSGNLVSSINAGTIEFTVDVNISDARAIKEIRVTLDNNTASPTFGLFRNRNRTDDIFVGMKPNTTNQVISIKPNWTGAITSLEFDTSAGYSAGNTIVKKIEIIGYGTKTGGTGEASYVNTEKIVAKAGTVWTYSNGQTNVLLHKGKYKMDVWGAQGAGTNGGNGGRSTGDITLTTDRNAYIFAGSRAGFNGGGVGRNAGGGATDIRLDGTSLENRIIVAGGGGAEGPAAGGAGGGGNNSGLNGARRCGSEGTGGTLSSGGIGGSSCGSSGLLGQGGSNTHINNNGSAGGGGGYYGGGAGGHDCWTYNDNDDSGGGGGSGYVNTSLFTNITGTTGGNVGEGWATITALEDIKTGEITYTFTPLKITYVSPFNDKKQTIIDNFTKIPDKLPNGTMNPIWLCRFQGLNAHVCNQIDENGNTIQLCRSFSILNCNEPHHRGEHYGTSNKICWSACGNDDNHKNTKTEVKVDKDGKEETLHLASFLQLDAGFTVYFPNRGNFEGNNKLGLAAVQGTRGKGYSQNMNTTNWTREKRVRFSFDVIYNNQMYIANQWIELEVPKEYFDFYLPVNNNEVSNASVEFEVEAINCGTGVGTDIPGGLSYNATVKNDYKNTLAAFLKNYVGTLLSAVKNGYKIPTLENKSTTALPYGSTGYMSFFDSKRDTLENTLKNSIKKVNQQIEKDFEGGSNANGLINPHTGSTSGINYNAKEITSNDNYIRVDNKMRSSSMESLHGGYKEFYLDILGRIGNFAIIDTEDFRFSEFFKTPIVSRGDTEALKDASNWLVDGVVLKVDDSIQNLYVGDLFDIRGNKANSDTRWLDTYGTQSWMSGQLTEIGRDVTKPNLVNQILTNDINNIDVLKLEPLRFGYDTYTSINTIGNYEDGYLQVIPKYYALKLTNKVDNNMPDGLKDLPQGSYIPLDVYINKDGQYIAANVFENAKNGNANIGNLPLYDYPFNLDWTSESGRRNYTLDEQAKTKATAEFLKQVFYEYPEDLTDNDTTNLPILSVKEYDVPKGKNNYLGTSQYVLMDGKHRTFIGSSNSYGNNVYNGLGGVTDFGINKNKGNILNELQFTRAVQRWHGKLGVPSSSVFIPHGLTPDAATITFVMNDNYAIVCTAEMMSIGNVWTLYYSQPWFTELNINGVKYGTGTHYPGHRVIDGNGKSVECPNCLPPIIAVYSSSNSSVDDLEIINTY